MGKNDFLTPKAIANRMKSKGLQKLRWYCQMCQKQCRDENGFKCHLTSESHRRQMEVFGQAPERVIDGYSEEFEAAFMEHLRRSHPHSRVLAKNVYNEFIHDKNHIHMNATKWLSLTDFVKYLGRTGQCKVEETEKGWYMTLIQRDPQRELDDAKRAKRERAEQAEEERLRRQMEAQIERAQKVARVDGGGGEDDEEADAGTTELVRGEDDAPLTISLAAAKARAAAAAEAAARPPKPLPSSFGDDDDGRGGGGGARGGEAGPSNGGAGGGKPRSKLEELMQRDVARKQAQREREEQDKKAADAAAAAAAAGGGTWLHTGIIVKVMSKALRDAGYYKAKAAVLRVLEKGKVAELEVLADGTVLRVDRRELETVIPQPGGAVLVVGGPQRGRRGTLAELDTDRFQARVELEEGPLAGKKLWLEYEDVCKLDKAV